MKLRIAFGLDLDALPLAEHWKLLDKIETTLVSYYTNHPGPFTTDLRTEKATGIIEIDFPGQVPADLHVFGLFFPRMDVYRWINISKEN